MLADTKVILVISLFQNMMKNWKISKLRYHFAYLNFCKWPNFKFGVRKL